MTEEQKMPALRFPEFTDQLDNDFLGDRATFSKGRGISKSDIDENGDLSCIRYGELYTTYGEVIDEVVSSTNLDPEKLVMSEPGDVIVPASGETQIDIATASCVLRGGVALSGDLNIIRSTIDGVFLAYYLGSAKKYEIARMAQGNSVVHLYAKQLKTLNLNLPSTPEQQKIATFLAAVDERLRLLEAQRKELLRYKEGMMQRIFDQELRFKDADGEAFPEWEDKRLGEVASDVAYGINSSATEYDGVNSYLRITDIDEETRQFKPAPLTSPSSSNIDKYVLEPGDIVFARTGASVGKSYLYRPNDGKLIYAGYLIRFKLEGVNPSFIFYQTLLESYQKWVSVMSIRSGQPGLNAEDYKSLSIVVPCIGEQKLIVDFLCSIDFKLRDLENFITASKSWKQGLLQNLFI